MILVTGGSSQGKEGVRQAVPGGTGYRTRCLDRGAEASWEEFMDGRFCVISSSLSGG